MKQPGTVTSIQSQVNNMLCKHGQMAGILNAITTGPKTSDTGRSNKRTNHPQPHRNKYLVTVKIQGKEVQALLDTGASHSFIQRAWAAQAAITTNPLPAPVIYGQASNGQIVVTSRCRTAIDTPYGRVEEALINVADITHQLLLGRDILDRTDIILRLEIATRGLNCPDLETLLQKATRDQAQVPWASGSPTGAGDESRKCGRSGDASPAGFTVGASTSVEHPALSESQRKRFTEKITREYADVFKEKLPDHIPPITKSTILHEIHLKDKLRENPTRGYYPIPHKFYESGKRVIFDHIKAGRLVPSNAPVAAPTFFKEKKEKLADPRMLVDYRQRNANTVRDATCVPKVDEILRLARGIFFARLDLTNAFSQIRMHPNSQRLTAINTPWGCYEWTIMPQGLCNSPSTWQRRINRALAGLIGEICFAYVDDIIVYGALTAKEHEKNVRKVLDALRKDGLLVNPSKSDLICKEVEILGHKISNKGIFPDYQKIDKVTEWPTPKTKRQIQQFMGLVNYLRKFIPNLAPHATVLTRLTRKNIPFKWTTIEQTAFEMIKNLTKNCLSLKPLDYESGIPIWLTTDASSTGIGAVLSQGHDWKDSHPVAFESRGYRGNEEKKQGEWNYPVHDKELLAIINALQKWRHLLLGAKFTICTDHESIKYLMTKKNLSDRQARWSTLLSEFDFDIRYVHGVDNPVADALS